MGERREERRMLAESVEDFVRGENAIARLRQLREQQQSFCPNVWAQLADLGWLGILVPENAGGLGLGVPELAIVAEGLGRGRLPEPYIAVAGLAAGVLAASDNQPVTEPLLAALASGERMVAVAWQEDPAEAILDEVRCSVEVAAGGPVLSGRKYLAVPAEADVFVVSASGSQGVGLYCVPADAPGVHTEQRLQVDGSRVADLRFDRVALGEHAVVAAPGTGSTGLQRGLAYAQVVASAELLGLSESLLQLTIDYLGSRKQFDRPLSAFQALRHRVVNLYIQTQLTRAALRHAIGVIEREDELPRIERAASRAKARASDAGMIIARDAVQLHGAIGYTEEADVGIYLHRILTLGAWLGNAAWHRRRYAELTRTEVGEVA